MPSEDGKRANRLLRALPDAEFERLEGQLQPRDLPQKQGLGEPGQRIDEVYFPVDAVVSVLTRMDEGQKV